MTENNTINEITDTELIYDPKQKGYLTTSNTDKNILSNVMNYNFIKINGVSYKGKYNSNTGLNKLTKGQLGFLINSIYKQMSGYGIIPKYVYDTMYEKEVEKINKYYYEYWDRRSTK